MRELFRKSFIALSLVSAFGVSASAFCFNNGCYTGGVGIGGVYSDLGGNDSANANAYGGYISAYGQSVYFGRLLAYGGVTFGSGAINKNGANMQALGSRKVYFAWEGLLKVGFNIASKDKPLFINLQAGADTILNRSFERALFFVGAQARWSLAA
ncbi:hypothetical protein DCO58_12155 [Helicobacter saguini]|uniref:Outer membrane beta-barrel protein n=1 Tax=Helicobacter saguini TaxID=1548018 RepID=A0A347VQG1_9HELI|nr:hypothetical protein [Helicobacter saguini]MWV60958.1 hypothetical protein [Helicobacter saguini]MWV68374.1 hypothetical protein [Helicobacter saguini]MWV70162.1 hypothetical protein [Helicobacter saguini]MWV72065.1 hypothetical protein [Helicobacter saguini]TLD93714.1 hypothetical protein LS64_007935 [Helicobacter saguini]